MVMFSDNSLPSLDEGSYSAILNSVIWLGLQAQDKRDADKYGIKAPTYRLKLVFEIPGRINKYGEVETAGKTVKNVTTHTKGAFLGLANVLLGKKMQSAELAKYLKDTKEPLKEVLGRQLTVNIAHFNSDDGLKSYIESIQASHPKDDVVVGVKTKTYFDPSSGDVDTFNSLTYHTQREVMGAVNANTYSESLQKAWVAAQEAYATKQSEKKAGGNDYSALA